MTLLALRAEASALAAHVEHFSTTELAAATRCGPWDVLTTLAHVIKGLDRAVAMVCDPVDGEVDPNPLIYYQSSQRRDPERDKTRQAAAIESADRFSDGEQLAEALRLAVEVLSRSAAQIGLSSAVATHWGPIMRLDDYLRTRVVEVAVHGMDVADALNRPVWTTPEAAAEVADLVRELVDVELPGSLRWSALDVVRIGTGRRRLTESELLQLGPSGSRFPAIQ